jgi:hypothetical protein
MDWPVGLLVDDVGMVEVAVMAYGSLLMVLLLVEPAAAYRSTGVLAFVMVGMLAAAE